MGLELFGNIINILARPMNHPETCAPYGIQVQKDERQVAREVKYSALYVDKKKSTERTCDTGNCQDTACSQHLFQFQVGQARGKKENYNIVNRHTEVNTL